MFKSSVTIFYEVFLFDGIPPSMMVFSSPSFSFTLNNLHLMFTHYEFWHSQSTWISERDRAHTGDVP
uniref:Uncharacterized protein n=1 Tax=Arion vulgaris TaxID=1028688 RepID=A0A0B7AMX1_9EUPU